MSRDEELELILVAAMLIFGGIFLFLIGWNPVGLVTFGFILLAASLLFLIKTDSRTGFFIMVVFWLGSAASLGKAAIDFTDNNISGAIVGIIVFLIVFIIIYRHSKN